MKKVIRDGEVAVLYSPGYGAGWSTWNSKWKQRLLFDPTLVEMVERKATAEEIDAYVKTWGDEYICTLGGDQLEIKWVSVGTRFEIHEYDGSESVRIFGPDWGYVA